MIRTNEDAAAAKLKASDHRTVTGAAPSKLLRRKVDAAVKPRSTTKSIFRLSTPAPTDVRSPAMSAVNKLLHTRMRVNDLERTIKFYTEALGLSVSRRHTSPRGAQLVFLTSPGSEEEIELCQMPGAPSVQVQPDLVHLAFEVDDLEGFAAEAARKGYPLSDGPTKTSSGSTIAFIDAPEGYEVELIQRPAERKG